MRLLMLNWRDPWHPRAGGAEVVSLRVAERLARRGWTVEWFSASYNGSRSEESRDGIRYVRAGGQASVHVAAFARYGRRPAFDVVVDQINTIPFMTPLYMRLPRVALVHQLAREVWIHEKGRILGTLGMFMEPYGGIAPPNRL